MTPFGSLVEPLVYCKINNRSGSGDGMTTSSEPPIMSARNTTGGSPGSTG